MSYHPTHCSHPQCKNHRNSGGTFIKKGFFKIRRINQTVRRFQCKSCGRTFSSRSFKPDYGHKKMDLNDKLRKLLVEGSSLRACSRILGMTYNNTCAKFHWLMAQARLQKEVLKYQAQTLYFDEMETIHHTKCKPLSIGVVVNDKYQILSLQVAEMPAKGRLAAFSVQKYGPRRDDREKMIEEMLREVQSKLILAPVEIKSDAKSSYAKHVRNCFPKALYETHSRAQKDRHRDRLHEKLHKKIYDPLFALNQRCAKLRSDIRRLTRRSWCTTKKPENLQGHLDLYLVSQFI